MLWRALREVETGFYVDVSAGDPRENSVTCAFYERGWSGVNVEPFAKDFEKLKEERSRDINLNVWVGNKPGVGRLLVSSAGTVSRSESDNGAELDRASDSSEQAVVPLLTLTQIVEDCPLRTIHFLRIQVGDAEAEVLGSLDLQRIRPWIILVRTTYSKSGFGDREKWEHLLTEQGYGFAYFDGLNCFYVAEEHSALKERFAAPPNIFDDFVRWQECQATTSLETLEKLLSEQRSQVANLSAGYEAEKDRTTQLRGALAAEQAQVVNLRTILKTEQAHNSSLRNALAAQQAVVLEVRNAPPVVLQSAPPTDDAQTLTRLNQISEEIGNVRAQLEFPWIDRALGHALKRLRETGDRITGGGIRAAAMRLLRLSLRRHPRIATIGRVLLKPFPKALSELDRSEAPPSENLALPETQPPSPQLQENQLAGKDEKQIDQISNPEPLVHSLYKTAFGQCAEPSELANGVHRLMIEGSINGLATQLVCSPEFQTQHGIGEEITLKYITSLYKNGLERRPDLDNSASWLARRNNGASRSDVLVAIATSDEALEKLSAPDLDANALYCRWIAENDTINEIDRTLIRTHIAALPCRPLISVIIAHPGTSEFALHESLNSVASQLYPYWQLCISFDDSSEGLLEKVLRDSLGSDPRVRVARVNHRGSPVNTAIGAATGEFVTFLKAADLLPEHAFYEVAVELGRNPKADILYGDCDEITWRGERHNPWFKPGWDPDLLLGQDYLSDPIVYRLALLEEIGFLTTESEGAEFYDLALRATARALPDQICHIPGILYHRRSAEADDEGQGRILYFRTLRERALRKHLDARGDVDAVITRAPTVANAFRIIWPTPVQPPLVSVIVPTRDHANLLFGCAEGVLRKTDYKNLELLIVDNDSVEASTRQLFEGLCREDQRVRVLPLSGPFNYAALNNYAAREANGEILLLLNNDIAIIDPDWLRELVSYAIRPEVGAVGAKLLYPDGRVQHGGMAIGPGENIAHIHRLADRNDPGYFGQLGLARTLTAVTGACIAMRRSVFFEAGGLNETHLKVAFNDVDLCLRVADLGYRVVWTPFAELIHLESTSRGSEDTPENRERVRRERLYMRKTWASVLESGDCFHNPNLLFKWDAFEMPCTPRHDRPWHHMVERVPDLIREFSPVLQSQAELAD